MEHTTHHIHRPVATVPADTLGRHSPVPGLGVQFCGCGNVFRLNECQSWIEMRSVPQADEVDFKTACQILHVSNSLVFALMKLGHLHPEKRHVIGKRSRWFFKEAELHKLRRRLIRRFK